MNGKFGKRYTVDLILDESNISANTTLNYNCNWQDYDLLFLYYRFWSNIYTPTIVDVHTYFAFTSSGKRPFCQGDGQTKYELWQNGSGKVQLLWLASTSSSAGLFVYGLKFLI